MIDEQWLWWAGSVSLAVFVLSLATLPWIVSFIPQDYFCHPERTPAPWKSRHPVLRTLLLIAKNLLGVVLLATGILMLFIPGQGLLTMVMGLVMMDYPGKYALERRVVSIPAIYSGLNWLRRRRNAPPLLLERE